MSEPVKQKKTWIWVVVGVLVAAVVLFGVFVGVVTMTVMRSMKVETPTATEAERTIDEQRQLFDSPPLVEIDQSGTTRRDELDKRMATYSGPPPATLRVMAWEDTEGKLVRFQIPFWVLRSAIDVHQVILWDEVGEAEGTGIVHSRQDAVRKTSISVASIPSR